MRWETHYSIEALLKAADAAAPHCSALSFDLFDTLLIRRTHDPDLVKPATARFIAAKAKAAGVEAVVFDHGGHGYHGRIAALADAAREGGLKF